LADRRETLLGVEGESRAMAATEHGYACFAYGGVALWSERDRDGARVLHRDYDQMALDGRDIWLIPDSDADTNPDVWRETELQAAALTARGARVEIVHLPPGPNGEKQGLDDFCTATESWP